MYVGNIKLLIHFIYIIEPIFLECLLKHNSD